jgi:GTPase SAR1 family protein
MAENNEYNVLILGPKGSGKTVLLSSLYYKMSKPDSTGFFLDAVNYFDGKLLKENYTSLSEEWPNATKFNHIEQWKFRCMLKTGKGIHNVFTINYHDYSGGRLTDAVMEDEDNSFKQAIEGADVLMGLVDGSQLLSAMKTRNYTSRFFMNDLERVLTALRTHHKNYKIVHLIISKWDLLNGYSLRDVSSLLLGFTEFKGFVNEIISHNGKIRIIPLSSVGFNFAELIGGVMTLKQNPTLEPYNVSVAVSLALLDPMKTQIEDIEKEAARVQAQKISVPPQLSWWQSILRFAGIAVQKYCEKQGISNSLLARMADYWKMEGDDKIEAARKKEIELREELKTQLTYVIDKKSAVEYVFKSFFANEMELDRAHPGSLIEKR